MIPPDFMEVLYRSAWLIISLAGAAAVGVWFTKDRRRNR